MKFGEQLESSKIKDYEFFYLDYDKLKKLLKPSGPPIDQEANGDGPAAESSKKSKKSKGPARQWVEEDEDTFVRELDRNLEKVYSKTNVVTTEIQRSIQVEEQAVYQLVQMVENRGLGEEGPSEEDFIEHEETLSNIIAEVHDLSKYVQINYIGFYKIVKKHDKLTNWHLKSIWDIMLKQRPFYKEDYEVAVVKLSKLYNLVRYRGKPVRGDSAAGGNQDSFVRQTTKYWIHPDNLTEVKLIILKHLPVLVFNAEKEFEHDDGAITSIYYDNPSKWDLYEGRLKKTEGAEAIRLRWYKGMQIEDIFVERKTHREDWTGEESVKERFMIKEKNVNAYLRGEMRPEAIFEKQRKDGKRKKDAIDKDERMAREVQYSVLKNGYVPVTRTFYMRTAYQLPGDARVRISIDRDLTMIREDNLDGRQRCGDNWRRMDIGIDYPFSQLPAEDIVRFPYAVLEVKLQTQHGQEPPRWIRELIASHLVEAVPKFSKFIHGTASLFPDRIKLLPFWMPQMDVDIRKPVTHDFGIRRQGHSTTSGSTSDDEDDDEFDSDDEEDPIARGGGANAQNSVQRVHQQLGLHDLEDQTVEEPVEHALYESDDEDDAEDQLEEARRIGGWTYYSTLAKTYAKATGKGAYNLMWSLIPHPRSSTVPRSNRLQMYFGEQQIQNVRFKAPKGKKIYVPIRVEPKVYFAAERTFLDWLEKAIYIGAGAATLLNFGTKPSPQAFVASAIFTVVALIALSYSLGIYLYRSDAIRHRKPAVFNELWGPSLLFISITAGLVLNFVYEGRRRDLW